MTHPTRLAGLMQRQNLLVSSLLVHAARHHGATEIVSRRADGSLDRRNWAAIERRARQLANALTGLGIAPGVRVATLAWNDWRHLEVYYAAPGMGAICHTVNPRLHEADIAYILQDAQDSAVFVDPGFLPILARIATELPASLTDIVVLDDALPAGMPSLPAHLRIHAHEALVEAASADFVWPDFDENCASALCYTSGTTGRPKGVLYSHRSTTLHAHAMNMADAMGFRAIDRVMPAVPMFHVNAWGIPYTAAMAGAALILPGRQLDGASLHALMNAERVTMTAGVPTVWLNLLAHLRASGGCLDTAPRIMTGGTACTSLLIDAFADEYGVRMEHAWGMSEISPVGTYHAPKPAQTGLSEGERRRHLLKQGRILCGLDMKIVDGGGQALPWDGVQFGDLMVRGPWVCSAYYGREPGSAVDADGWFATGDVATIDADGFMEITDRSKDVIKSGGEWISSITLENIAQSHPDVAEAAVIAARHPKWDERPLLLVVPCPGRDPSAQALLAAYEGQVPKWWLPDAVLVLAELPHTATGKVQKNVLRERHADHLIRQKNR